MDQDQWPRPTSRADLELRRERAGIYLRGRAGPFEGEINALASLSHPGRMPSRYSGVLRPKIALLRGLHMPSSEDPEMAAGPSKPAHWAEDATAAWAGYATAAWAGHATAAWAGYATAAWAGYATAARDGWAELLSVFAQALGADNSDTLVARNNLATWTGEAGDAAAARDQFAALLPEAERILGADHPETVSIRANLARWTGEAGDAAAARDQYAALLPEAERVLGPYHPGTLVVRNNHAAWAGEAGNVTRARDEFAALLPEAERVLGPDHPGTLAVRNNHAAWTGEAGNVTRARDEFAALLPEAERVLGPDHPETMIVQDNLASVSWADEQAWQVNAFICRADTEEPVADRPLALHTRHDVLCNIGIPDPRSLLSTEDSAFPRHLLPAGPLQLRAVLHVEGSAKVEVESIALEAGKEASTWARLPLPTADVPGTIRAELAIYYEVVAVHVQVLLLPVGGPMAQGGPSARLVYRLSRRFADLGRLSDRHASIIMTDQTSSSSVLVNGLTFAPNAFAINHNAADNAARVGRLRMYAAHFRVDDDGREINNYQTRNTKRVRRHGKADAEFRKDLAALAHAGSDIFDALFKQNIVAVTLADLLRAEAHARDRVPTIQVVDLSAGHPIPWALLYDLPFSGVGPYDPCPSIADFGPASEDLGPIPSRCPYEDRHRDADGRWRDAQLCPWGFWGLSTALEHPPDCDRSLEEVIAEGYSAPTFLMAVGPGLDGTLREEHIAALDQQVLIDWARPPICAIGDVRHQLADDNMDVVYFYCHCDYNEDAPGVGVIPYLRLDATEPLTPSVISAWARSAVWPIPHWPDRHPLVVINGCRTTEWQSGSLVGFVEAFVGRAGAAGVIGTEITIDQGVASWAMELFLAALSEGASVGMALRQTRWAMFRRGNLMGFAYTPYCLANLSLRRLRQPTREASLK